MSADCVLEAIGRQDVVTCTSVLIENLSDEINKTVGVDRFIELTLEDVDFTNLNSLEDFMYRRVNLLTVSRNSRPIQGDAFRKFRNLHSLRVYKSNVATTKLKIILGNLSLKTRFVLKLFNNTIDSVNSTCNDNPRLHTLILGANNISSLHNHSFGQCPRLTDLDLTYNRLTNISVNIFHGLSYLLKFNISNNPIKYVSRNTFSGLSSLHNLDISHCRIKDLEAGSFNGLYKLRNLTLENNEIKVLVSHTFNETKKLKFLELQGNAISEIKLNHRL